MALQLIFYMRESLLQLFKEYNADSNRRYYVFWMVVIALVLYELLLLFFATPHIARYDGVDAWFQFFYHVVPSGSLLFSTIFVGYYGYHLYLDANGIKSGKEKRVEKTMMALNPGYDFGPKQPVFFKPVSLALMLLESLFWGALLYLVLPPLVYQLSSGLIPDLVVPRPYDTLDLVRSYQTNAFQNIALALGGGFYEEIIFRFGLYWLLIRLLAPRFSAPGFTFFIPKETWSKYRLSSAVILLCAVIFSASHFLLPAGDPIHFYTFLFRILFGLAMSLIFFFRGLGKAVWAHAFYEIFYFAFT